MKPEYDLDYLPNQTFYGDYSKSIPMNKNSQIITKIKPKIRIIHIFAPEIINTDVKNFRPLVQSLTGKPEKKKTTKTKFPAPPPLPQESGQEQRAELVNGSHTVKEEEWGSCSNPNTYFDFEGLIDLDDDDNMFSSRWFDIQQQ
ncbi:unnamed protein product [Arabis nemorensis]|uniref:VQ domain-containing protein n=1 Tax=Arabis nemorensis TaxID=586526 RepID=A0A565BY42_9BRAS|nr:unnamed protein product [Arabis nemorensis]